MTLHTLDPTPEEGLCSASRSGLFTLGKAARYHCTGSKGGLQAVLDGFGKHVLRVY